jgi:hypothetical protein
MVTDVIDGSTHAIWHGMNTSVTITMKFNDLGKTGL